MSYEKNILAAFVIAVMVITIALPTYAANAVNTVKWNGETDKAVAVNIDAVQSARDNASGAKIASSGQSTDLPGVYFIWDANQKDSGYLKVDANVFATYESFTLTAKESNTYWDYVISLNEDQKATEDGCYVFYIPNASGNKSINMVFIGELNKIPEQAPLPEYDITVDPYNIDDVNRVIDLYGLLPQTAAVLFSFAESCESGDTLNGKMTLETNYNPLQRAIREFVGYGGFKYREETIMTSGTSGLQDVYTSSGTAFASYLSTSINTTLITIAQSIMDTIATGGIPVSGVLSAWMPPAYSSNAQIKHQACLFKQRTVKVIYQNDNGQYYYPAQSEMVTYNFDNSISIAPTAGQWGANKSCGQTPIKTYYRPYYNSGLDQLAYQYKFNGYKEGFNSAKYGNCTFLF